MDTRTWLLVLSDPGNASWNMAADEYFFRMAVRTDRPVLRLYTWSPPGISLGYAQKPERHIDVSACRKDGVGIVRRLTGGKAVYHDRELTYSVTGPISAFPFNTELLTCYRHIAHAFIAAFSQLDIPATLAGEHIRAARVGMTSCFAQPSAFEVLVHGRKILGSAQKRTRDGVLQHGSLLMEYEHGKWVKYMLRNADNIQERITSIRQESNHTIETVRQAVISGFESVFNISFERFELSDQDVDGIRNLAENCYANL